MKITGPVTIRFSGITIRFNVKAPLKLHDQFTHLICENVIDPDVVYDIEPLSIPLTPRSPLFYNNQGTEIYRYEEGWLRIYPMRIAKDGCQVACLLRPNDNNVMYYPTSMWDHYTSPLQCAHFLGLEQILAKKDAFLLHSSVVEVNGKAVLFSGPSEAGKSTQADLWAKHLGADILNGDRCVIRKYPHGFYGGGSPLAGSSGIYRSEHYPIAGIFLLQKAPFDRVERVHREAFSPMLQQTLVNIWDPGFMDKILYLYQELLDQVPIYRLSCRADEEAVHLAYRTLF